MADDPVREYLSKLGKRGGQARARNLTPAQRTTAAVRAAKARWVKERALTKELVDGTKQLLRDAKKAEKRSAARHSKIKKLLRIAKGQES